VRLSARLHSLPDVEASTLRAIAEVELMDAKDRATGGYSKGMKQRVKIAAAIVHDPAILILDEPFNGADPRQRLRMMDMLRRRADEGATIVFSSHILEEVERLATNVLVIVAGRLAASGDFHAIRRLMTDRPHSVSLRSSDNRQFAASLVGDDAVFGVEISGDQMTVKTSDLLTFAHVAPRLAKDSGVTLYEISPTDESLESVFSYLVRR
jgi:ABC-2 type transport system ATP-binding protein